MATMATIGDNDNERDIDPVRAANPWNMASTTPIDRMMAVPGGARRLLLTQPSWTILCDT